MKTTRLVLFSLFTVAAAAAVTAGCSEIESYKIDAPDYLQSKIDSIAQAKQKKDTGDTTYVDITVPVAGAEDFSSGFWTAFSQDFVIPANKLLHVDFINHGSEANNWNNWNITTANTSRDATGYSEYFTLRSDAYGWGNSDYNATFLKTDYDVAAADAGYDDTWEYFRSVMNGATVEMELDHSKTGNVYVTAVQHVTDGRTLTETYEQPVSATEDMTMFLVCDGSWFEVKSAYLIPSKIQEVEDQNAVSITVSGQPSVIEVGQTDFWGDAVATVTFADGSVAVADTTDITFTVPDLTTVGEKTILYSYSKTKLGNYGTSVAGYYTLKVVNPVVSLAVTAQPDFNSYYVFDQSVAFSTSGMEVTATYADESTDVMDLSSLTFGRVDGGETGTRKVSVSYEGTSGTVSTECSVNVTRGTSEVGAADFTNGWWTTFSPDTTMSSDSEKIVKYHFLFYSDCLANFHCPCVLLRKVSDSAKEYAVVRMDNYGWGDGYGTAVLESDWDWDTFLPGLNLCTVDIAVTNHGNGTADVRYDVVYASGETHYQTFTGISVDSSDIMAALLCEESYMVLY